MPSPGTEDRSVVDAPSGAVTGSDRPLVLRDIAGETVMGMRVAAWMWSEPINQAKLATEAPSEITMVRFATHWSTGPKTAQRLLREEDVRTLLGDTHRVLIAAMHALRSYQYGNSAPDLAEAIANACAAASDALSPQSQHQGDL